MKTRIKTVHEEMYNQNDGKNKRIGILLNTSTENYWSDSFAYINNNTMYIFFPTIIEMMDYLRYGEVKMKRAYLEEEEFDNFYDSPYINGKFEEHLIWTTD